MENKICGKCKIIKSLSEFNKKGENRLSSFCKDCNKEYLKSHYQKNKKYYIDKRKRWLLDNKKWLMSLKKQLKCSICSDDRWWVLDFHHNNPQKKYLEISKMLGYGFSKESILKEIEKCTQMCSNCHRDFHFKKNKDKYWINN